MERVCRRCFSRLLSVDSTFGRFEFDSTQILGIVQWMDVPTLGSLYRLNVKWHGILSSNLADQLVWSHLCSPYRVTKAAQTMVKVADGGLISSFTSAVQSCRQLYLRKIGIKKFSIAVSMLERYDPLGREAARSLMMVAASSSDATVSIHAAVPALVVAACSNCIQQGCNDLLFEKASFAAGALLNFTRTRTDASCRALLSCKGVDRLLSNVRIDSLVTKTHIDLVTHSVGTVWNVFRWSKKTGAVISSDVLRTALNVFGACLETVNQRQMFENQMLQLLTNCSGVLSFCCIVQGSTALTVTVLSSLLRVMLLVLRHADDNREKERKESRTHEMSRFFRAACTTMRNAVLHSEAALIALCESHGLRTMVELLAWDGDTRVSESSSAVICNATADGNGADGASTADEDTAENISVGSCRQTTARLRERMLVDGQWCALLAHIGQGSQALRLSWEYCAGVLRNITSGGVLLSKMTAPLLQELLIKIQELVNKQNKWELPVLAHLCGAVCNLSLVRGNLPYFQQYQANEVLEKVGQSQRNKKSEETRAQGYARQALKNL